MQPDLSKFFTQWKDPTSGVISYILTKKVAPVQEAFYFVNSSFSNDNRYLWFYCAFPPSGSNYYGRTLGVIDFKNMSINHFPETAFSESSPLVCDDTGGVYWASEKCLCYRSPDPKEKFEIISNYPNDLFGDKKLGHMATHLTLSPNKKELFFDAQSGIDFFAGTINIENGKFDIWKKFDRKYNHGQVCPVDENLSLLAQENMIDMYTGVKTRYEDRLWLLKRDGTFNPIFPEKTRVTHEWWDSNGIHIYAVNQIEQLNGPAIIRINKNTSEFENIWKGQYWHAHDFNHGKWLVADKHHLTDFYRGCPSSVYFINREINKELTIISLNPEHHTPGNMYHIDPHPRFSPDGSMIIFTTTVLGEVDVAIVFTKSIIKTME